MFQSPEQALAFAFRMRHSVVLKSPSLGSRTDPDRSDDALTGFDLHAQAGMVFSWLSRRPEDEQIYAFYLHGTIKERRLAAWLLVRKNRRVFSKYKLTKRQLLNALIGNSVRESSAESGLTNWKAWKLRRDLADLFEPIQMRLMTAMYQEFVLPGTPLLSG